MYKNFTNYDVLEDGRIWSKKRKMFLNPSKDRYGYLRVNLYDNDGKRHFETVHKIVFFAVNGLWEYPEGHEINHLDENKENNQISNLELVTPKQNSNHGTRNSRVAAALTNRLDQSKRVGAFKNGVLQMVFPSTKEAERNGFNHSAVAACCNGKLKTHNGFVWKYLDEQ